MAARMISRERVRAALARTEPDRVPINYYANAGIDRRLAVQLEVTRRVLEAAEGRVDFVWMGEDLGSQNGPLISVDLYRRHLRPRHQRIADLARSFGLPVMIHSCGSSSWAFADFIEMGIAAVDTLQPEAANMSPAYLKSTFGDRLAFHGCISTAGALSFGTAGDVRRDVAATLACMMPGGGYCLAPTHSIQDNSPVENVLAMYEAAQELGRYTRAARTVGRSTPARRRTGVSSRRPTRMRKTRRGRRQK